MIGEIPRTAKVAGGSLLAIGALAAGAALGATAARTVVRRSARPDEDWSLEDFNAHELELEMSDGTTLHVEVDEPEDPTRAELTIVFSHGYALSLDSWYFQRKELHGRARLVTYDQRSHGKSERADFDTHHVDQLGDDLGRVIDAVAPTGPLVLIGHSMGGMTIMALAEQRPELIAERVYGVVLVSSAAGGLQHMPLGLPGILTPALSRAVPAIASLMSARSGMVERARKHSGDLNLLLTRLYSFGTVASEQAGKFVSQMIDRTPIDVLAEFIPALQEHDKTDALSILQQTEVLVIAGTSDRLTPISYSREIVQAIPGAELVEIEDGGHMALIEFHEQVDEQIAAFIDRVWRNIDAHRAQA